MRGTLLSVGALATLAAADLRFKSRPEFNIPTLNITVPATGKNVEEGYIFAALYEQFGPLASTGPVQPGPYIFRDDGELVWSGVGYTAGWAANFVPDTWKGKRYLRAFQGSLDFKHGRMFGTHVLLDQNYNNVKTVKAGNHKWNSAHEFNIIDGENVLIEVPIPVFASLRPWGGEDGQEWVVSSGFQEVNIESGEVNFEWYAFDHVDPKRSMFPLDFGEGLPGTGRNESDGWNYFHINSVDKDDQGNYLISARNMACLFKINGTSGDIIWQLGGLKGGSDFDLSEEDVFAFQHHARFRGRSDDGNKEVISLFDNGAHSAPIKTHKTSRARIYELDHRRGKAIALRTFEAPDGLSARTQGSVEPLPNGNVFVDWGQAGAITEFANDGEVLFHSYLDSAPDGVLVQAYRAFRSNWTGTPSEEPAVLALSSHYHASLDVYVSWNGDTETALWRFFDASSKQGEHLLLGEVKREGFETHGTFELLGKHGDVTSIVAKAFGATENLLRQSRPVSVERVKPESRFNVPPLVKQGLR